MPGGDAPGESPRVVASPTQFSDGSATNLKSADAINGDRPVPRQLLDPLCQRGRGVHGRARQHIAASGEVHGQAEIQKHWLAILILERGF